MIEMEEDGIDAKFKQIFEYIQHGKYFQSGIMFVRFYFLIHSVMQPKIIKYIYDTLLLFSGTLLFL